MKVRWCIMGALALFTLATGLCSPRIVNELSLNSWQLTTLILILALPVGYNVLFTRYYHELYRIPGINLTHIILDLVVITGLIHFSGGSSSWLWPAYLIITIEASILLNKPYHVWIIGALGSLLYGLLLFTEHTQLLSSTMMPSSIATKDQTVAFLVILWSWVCFLNAIVSLVGALLMKIVRQQTAEAIASEKRLSYMAHHDVLTGLPNRTRFVERAEQAKTMAKREKTQLAFLFLDLDRFKAINDTLGHAVGDQLLCTISKRLVGMVRESDIVCRLGGDEFAMMLTNVENTAALQKLTNKIISKISEPIFIAGHEILTTCSIGISLYPQHGTLLENLLQQADAAMYSAKEHGRNNYQLFTPDMDNKSDKRLTMEHSLRKALEQNEFELYYQPKVNIETGEVISLEALLRWNHPELGIILPGDFIPLAEETGFIFPIGEWVLRQVCKQSRSWQKNSQLHIRIAVNISGRQLHLHNFVQRVNDILCETGLDPKLLELEVTENVIMQNPESAVNSLNRLADKGILISIDDFGAGYSSLAHLQRSSISTLKISKIFIQNLENSEQDAAIAQTIINIAESLNLKVIAEGVETPGQLSFLKHNHCNEIQGYLYSAPIPEKSIPKLLGENSANQTRTTAYQVQI